MSAQTAESGVWLVTIAGDLDGDHAAEMGDLLRQGLRPGGRLTVIEASGVVFADSSVLDTLLRARAEYTSADVELVIADASTALRRLLDVTGTASAFAMADSVQAAMAY